MFGMGMNEILIVLVIAVIVIGPKQLPQLARAMGKMVAQFKRATNDLRDTISDEVNQHVPMNEIHEMRDSLEDGVRDLQNQSHALVESEIENDKRIGREVAGDLKSAMNDIPNADWDYGPGNGGEPKKKSRKSTAAKSSKKTKAVAANGGTSAKKTVSAKRSGMGGGKGGGKGNGVARNAAKSAATRGAAAKTIAAKSTGKGGAKSRQGGRA